MSMNTERKRVILTMGGKGGVGKTSFITVVAEWLADRGTPCTLLDLDIENKAKGSFQNFFAAAEKLNVNTPAGLDAFVDRLEGSASILMADMGAGSGKVTHDWFDAMHASVSELGIGFTAVGLVTDDPASVDSVLSWGAALQDRVDYLIVENAITAHAEFTYWRGSEQAKRFREIFHPVVIRMGYRIPDLETACRNHGVTLGEVAGRKTDAVELQRTSLVLRAQSYRSQLFAEIDQAKDLLLA
jgi:MinD-like ATPase involved in chromosome partitioning or flagellar assembly